MCRFPKYAAACEGAAARQRREGGRARLDVDHAADVLLERSSEVVVELELARLEQPRKGQELELARLAVCIGGADADADAMQMQMHTYMLHFHVHVHVHVHVHEHVHVHCACSCGTHIGGWPSRGNSLTLNVASR